LHKRKVVLVKLTEKQAIKWEKEMRKLEKDPKTTKTGMRIFMQISMNCGHAAGNLLTCSEPPSGCVICNSKEE